MIAQNGGSSYLDNKLRSLRGGASTTSYRSQSPPMQTLPRAGGYPTINTASSDLTIGRNYDSI